MNIRKIISTTPLPQIRPHSHESPALYTPAHNHGPTPKNPGLTTQRLPFSTPIKNTMLSVINPNYSKNKPIMESIGTGVSGPPTATEVSGPFESLVTSSHLKTPLNSPHKGSTETPLKSPVISLRKRQTDSPLKRTADAANYGGTPLSPSPSVPVTTIPTSTLEDKGKGKKGQPSTPYNPLTVRSPVSTPGSGGGKGRGIEKGSVVEGNFDNQGEKLYMHMLDIMYLNLCLFD